MDYLITIKDLNDIDELTIATGYILGNENYAVRLVKSFSLDEIYKSVLKAHKLNKKIYVLVNRIFFDEDLSDLKDYIKKLLSFGVDYFLFSDLGVFLILEDLNECNKSIFYHESLNRSYSDMKAYLNEGVSKVVISKDCPLKDIKRIKDKKQFGMIINGYLPIYYSKRRVVSEFKKKYKIDDDNDNGFSLEEQSKHKHYHIIEEKGGVSIFDEHPVCQLHYMNELKNYLDFIIIDTLFFEDDYSQDTLEAYYEKIENGKDTNYLEKYKKYNFDNSFLNREIEALK